MLQSILFPTTLRQSPKDAESVSADLLVRAGYAAKLMAGVYSYQPLGLRVYKKIEDIIRKHMNGAGAQELLLPTLQPKELWELSGRWQKLSGDMYQFKDDSGKEIGLAMTHEEVIVGLLRNQPLSYQNLPLSLYQFQNKFRHEPRAKSGLLRTREFIMKDLYSIHTDEADMDQYYEKIKEAYIAIFSELSIPAVPTVASGGVFSEGFSHEFQSIAEIGEDTIYVCPKHDYAFNKEVLDRLTLVCPHHQEKLEPCNAVEVGNIFKLGTKFSTDMNVMFTDSDGEVKPFWMASYGIGLGRAMAMVIEHHHDDKGIIWPENLSPFAYHLLDLTKEPSQQKQALELYQDLQKDGIEILFDNRDLPAGVKFADADLIGIHQRLIISAKSLAQNSIEVKLRSSQESSLVKIDSLKNLYYNSH